MTQDAETVIFPNGWFAVASSQSLPKATVRAIQAFDRELVMFRTAQGEAQVVDAHCPHLGAHLGQGGRVKGDRIICPFHEWEFDRNGMCQRIPYASRIPSGATLRCWHTREVNGFIQVYYHVSGLPPDREPKACAALEDTEWRTVGYRQFQLKSNPMELSQNAADDVHLRSVHNSAVQKSSLQVNDEVFHNTFELQALYGDRLLPIWVHVEHRIYNLGHMVINSRLGRHISIQVIQYCTPLDVQQVMVHHRYLIWGGHGWQRLFRSFGALIMLQISLFSAYKDWEIWKHQRSLPRPILSEGDGMLARFRAWAQHANKA